MCIASELITVILIKSQAEQELTPKATSRSMLIRKKVDYSRACRVGEQVSEVDVGSV